MPGPLYEREAHWIRQVGAGVIWTGPCYLLRLLFYPVTAADTVSVYDGTDAMSGRLFHTLAAATVTTLEVSFGEGVRFEQGIYVNVAQGTDVVTAIFHPALRGQD